ncbi:MAG: hypothetical protein ACTHXO_08625 [Actinomycetaceae bacterium]
MARTIRPALAGVLALGFLAAGCSANPGTAAVIDGEDLSESTAQEMAAQLSEVFGGEIPTVQAIAVYAQADAVIQASSEAGQSLTEAEVLEQMTTMAAQSGSEAGPEGYLDETVTVAHSQFVASALQADQEVADRFLELSADVELELNPRYGTYDGTQVAAPAHPWIAAPAPDEGLPTAP